jgi:hypothetical protein
MMLNRTKQNSLLLIVKQLQPLQNRKNFSIPAAPWVNTKCGINPFNPTSFRLTHSPASVINNDTRTNYTHRFTRRSFATSGAVAELDESEGIAVTNAVTWENGGDSSLAVRVERLESRTNEVLSKIDSAKQQWQKNPLPSPMLPPSLRSQIVKIIQSWGSLWGKKSVRSTYSTGEDTRNDFCPQSYIQRGVQASNQLLDAVLQDDLRICRTGGKIPNFLNSQVGKHMLLSCAVIVSCYKTRNYKLHTFFIFKRFGVV